MPDSFFVNDRKRKRAGPKAAPSRDRGSLSTRGASSSSGRSQRAPPSKRKQDDDEELTSKGGRFESDSEISDDDVDARIRDRNGGGGFFEGEESEEEEFQKNETAQQKRLRLAKGYLDKVRDEVAAEALDEGAFDAADVDREILAARLQKDADEVSGRIHSFIGSRLTHHPARRFIPSFASHALTSVTLSPTLLFTANKKGTIVAYDLKTLEVAFAPFGQNGRSGLPDPSGSSPNPLKKKAGKTSESQSRANGGGKVIVSSVEAAKVTGHKGEILCLAASQDGRYLVSGGRDKMIGVWEISRPESVKGKQSANGQEPLEIQWLRAMPGHKDAVTSIVIPPLGNSSHHILSASLSRYLCLHSLSTLSLIDTFFGHQDVITSVSSIKPSVAVTTGARDRTCRWWKVEEEVQLVFRGGGKSVYKTAANTDAPQDSAAKGKNGQSSRVVASQRKAKPSGPPEFHEGSIDSVCMIDDSHFLSGGDTGTISLWHTGKKKPIFSYHFAHGVDETESETEGKILQPRWITSLAALRGTDIFASGSWDGSIRLWSVDSSIKSFTHLFDLSAPGFVNSIDILALPAANLADLSKTEATETKTSGQKSSKPKLAYVLAAAVASEPRLGRWMRKPKAKTGTLLFNLSQHEGK